MAPTQRQSLPGLRLIELAARLEPNDTVPIEFLPGQGPEDRLGRDRGRARHAFRAGPGGRPFAMRFRRPGPDGTGCRWTTSWTMDAGLGGLEFLAGSPLADLELAPLNPDLGQYFGTTEGVLVISAPQGRSPGPQGRRRGPGGGRPEAGRPLPPAAHLAELRSGRNLQAGHPAEPEAGDGDRPAWATARPRCQCAPAHRCP